ncbi:MAG: hypothetical protein KTR31_03880 [Myxococcales bacterium]|nr:hypothetical protein [Myxococcales bacterium]
MCRLSMLSLSVAACTPVPTEMSEPLDTPEPVEDSAAPVEPMVPPTDVTFVVTGDVTGMGISVQNVSLGPFVSAPLTGASHTFTLEEPPDRSLSIVEEDGEKIEAAFYYPAIHEDDGDGVPETGEGYAGVGDVLVFVPAEFEGSAALATRGWTIGWNTTSPAGLSAIPLTIHEPVDSLTISGRYEGEESVRIAVAPAVQPGVEELLHDELLLESWAITLTGEPPSDHASKLGYAEIPGAVVVERPVVYTDDDGSGSFTTGDSLVADLYLCGGDEGRMVRLGWFPRTFRRPFNFFVTHGRSGWHLMEFQGGSSHRIVDDPTEGEDVSVGPCEEPPV